MLLTTAAHEWLTERRAVGRTISDSTAEAYRYDLNRWVQYLQAQVGHDPTTGDLDPVTVKAALADMHDQGLSPASRTRALVTMRGFCRWLTINGHLAADPTLGLQAPRKPGRLPVAFTDEQVAQLFDTAQQEDPTARKQAAPLDMALLLILAAAGLRASETAQLDLRDYTPGAEPALHVRRGKGGNPRTVPIAPAVAAALDTYLEWRADTPADDEDTSPLLVRPNGTRFTRYAVDYRIGKLYKRAGVPKPDGELAHALRHTYAISMVNNGVPINEVQELLGHQNLATTGIYLKASGQHLRTAAASSTAARLADEL